MLITPHQAQPLRYTLSNPFTARNHRESRLTNKTRREPAKNATSLRTPGPFDMQILAIIIPGNDDSRYVFAAVAWPDSPRPGERGTNSFSRVLRFILSAKVEKTFQGFVIDTDQFSANLTSRLLSFLSLKFPIYDIISFDSLFQHSFERIFP